MINVLYWNTTLYKLLNPHQHFQELQFPSITKRRALKMATTPRGKCMPVYMVGGWELNAITGSL